MIGTNERRERSLSLSFWRRRLSAWRFLDLYTLSSPLILIVPLPFPPPNSQSAYSIGNCQRWKNEKVGAPSSTGIYLYELEMGALELLLHMTNTCYREREREFSWWVVVECPYSLTIISSVGVSSNWTIQFSSYFMESYWFFFSLFWF